MSITIHPTAIVETDKIGDGTVIWHWAHIMSGAKIGKNCMIGDRVFVGNNVVIGDNVRIQNNVYIPEGVIIWNDVFIGPNVVFTNVKYPDPTLCVLPKNYEKTIIWGGVIIGANSTILPGIELYNGAFIGAGSVVTKDVNSGQVVVGNPAKDLYENTSKHLS